MRVINRGYISDSIIYRKKMNSSKVVKPIKVVGEWVMLSCVFCCLGF